MTNTRQLAVRNLLLMGVAAFVLWRQLDRKIPWASMDGPARLTVIITVGVLLIGAWRVTLLLRRSS